MGCDYYILTMLKIIHKNGVERIVLDKQLMYQGNDSDIETPHILVYKKGELELSQNTKYYLKLVKDEIDYYLSFPSIKWGELKNIEDISEMYLMEMRSVR